MISVYPSPEHQFIIIKCNGRSISVPLEDVPVLSARLCVAQTDATAAARAAKWVAKQERRGAVMRQ